MNREQLKKQIVNNFDDHEITEKERLINVMQCVDAYIEQLPASRVSDCSIPIQLQAINTLTNTLAVNKNELGNYHSLRDNAFEKLNKLVKSIDI